MRHCSVFVVVQEKQLVVTLSIMGSASLDKIENSTSQCCHPRAWPCLVFAYSLCFACYIKLSDNLTIAKPLWFKALSLCHTWAYAASKERQHPSLAFLLLKSTQEHDKVQKNNTLKFNYVYILLEHYKIRSFIREVHDTHTHLLFCATFAYYYIIIQTKVVLSL